MKTVFTITLLITLICSTQISFAQQNVQDVVYLKNGNIIRGTIIEQVPNKSLRLQTYDGSIFVYQMDDIEKITKQPLYERPELQSNVGKYVGYFFFGFAPQITKNSGPVIKSLHLVNGIFVGRNTTLGVGIGYEFYNDYSYYDHRNVRFIPIWLDIRTYFFDDDFKPFIYGNIGFTEGQTTYNYSDGNSTSDWQDQGLNYVFGAGVKYDINQNFGLLLELGFRGQEIMSSAISAITLHFGITY